MVVFDSTFLVFLFVPSATCGVDRPRDRVNELIGTLHGRGEKIAVPAPALSELLVRAGDSKKQIIHDLTRTQRFQVEAFDTRSAIEVALMTEKELAKGPKRGKATDSTWAKVKYDRQIVAIAKVLDVRTIYSQDEDVLKLALANGIEAKAIVDCQLPPPPKTSDTGDLFGTTDGGAKSERRTPEQTTSPAASVQGSSSGHSESEAGSKTSVKENTSPQK